MIVVLMPHCCAASAVTGPIEATRPSEQVGDRLLRRSDATKLRTVDALVNVTTSTCRSSSIR